MYWIPKPLSSAVFDLVAVLKSARQMAGKLTNLLESKILIFNAIIAKLHTGITPFVKIPLNGT